MHTYTLDKLALEAALRHALERGEFRIHYQPKIDMASGDVTGVEALLRWQHPEHGLVGPDKFIPLAEATGMIVPLAVLPGWLGPISWVLVPTWGMAAIRDAAIGAEPPWLAIVMCLVLSVAYYLIARRMLVYVIDKARRDATLNLA